MKKWKYKSTRRDEKKKKRGNETNQSGIILVNQTILVFEIDYEYIYG